LFPGISVRKGFIVDYSMASQVKGLERADPRMPAVAWDHGRKHARARLSINKCTALDIRLSTLFFSGWLVWHVSTSQLQQFFYC
jgi:hypothetical protein